MAEPKVEAINWLLLADGTSDRALEPVIEWTLRKLWDDGNFAKPVFIPRKHQSIKTKIDEILREYRPDLLFVHRDAESSLLEERRNEIPLGERTIPVIPVRMTEAWLLIDEMALRKAANNPNGGARLSLPPTRQLERLNDPKEVLHRLLLEASGYKNRRRAKFNIQRAVHRLANLIDDYAPLLQLSAYVEFRNHLEQSLGRIQNSPSQHSHPKRKTHWIK